MPKHAGTKSRNAVVADPRLAKVKVPTSRGTPGMQQDPFAEVEELLMSRATDTPSPETSSSRPTGGGGPATVPSGKVVCPFCGSVNDRPSHDYDNTACPRCSMADTPGTRQATRARLGPWFVRQTRNPAAPGMKFDTLMALVKRGQVTGQSVVRGPTTNQFWRFAAQVKGLSREFGLCYNCATPVDKAATICPQCNRMQEPPANPDVLLENAPAATAPSNVASTPAPAAVATVHREIKPPAPAQQPELRPAAPAAAAIATAERRPQRSLAPTSRRDPSPVARDEAPQRTDLLAPTRPRPAARQRTADDGILSAQDLATAFQLDFKPESRRSGAGFKRIAVVAVLLAVSIGAIALIMNQDYRDKAHVWLSEQSTAVRGLVTGRAKPAPAATPAATPSAPAPAAQPKAAPVVAAAVPATQPSPDVAFPIPPRPAEPAPETLAAKPALPETQPAPASAPETRPVAQQQPPQQPAPSAQVTVAPVPSAPKNDPAPRNQAQQQQQQARDSGKDQPVAKVAAAPVEGAKASEQAIALWRQALDAEARRDYAKAVEHYEAIKKLPKNTWPAGLEINLSLAKKRVK
jgi:hypothetical protein